MRTLLHTVASWAYYTQRYRRQLQRRKRHGVDKSHLGACKATRQSTQRGKQEKAPADYLGLSLGAMSRWKYDGSYVYTKHIYEICEYLDTTPNYLFLDRRTGKKDSH